MYNESSIRVALGCVSILLGIGLLLVRADRQFISLPPTTGLENAVPLNSSIMYEQEFVVHRSPINRLGIYVRPLTEHIPDKPITVQIVHDSIVIDEQRISAVFANLDSATAIRLREPFTLQTPDRLRIQLTVPPELSGKVALQTRIQDETFNKDAVFSIHGEAQPNPLAYEVYYSARPTITLFVGALIILAGVLLIARVILPAAGLQVLYVAGVVVAGNIPVFAHGIFPIPLIAMQIIVLFFVFHILRRTFSIPAALLGAHTMAFTSWWSLVFIGGRNFFPTERLANVKEILADPNQVVLSDPGAYVGMFVIVLAIVGFLLWRQSAQWRRWQWISVGAIITGMVVHPLLAAAGAAILGTIGVQALLQFLGQQDRLVRLLLYILVYLSLVDILTVYNQILEKV